MLRFVFLVFIVISTFLPTSAYSLDEKRKLQQVFIDVGEYNLSFNFRAGTKPAIVFESGSGVDSSHWNNIVETLSNKIDNTIITYDRAGYGLSELPKSPYDIYGEVEGLKKGLEQLGYANSIVYVGHSYAYYLMEMYGAKYSNSVNSLVFIDPITVDFIDAMGGIEEELKNIDLSQLPNNNFGKALTRETEGLTETYTSVKNLRDKYRTNCFIISAEKPEWSSSKEVYEWQAAHKKLSERCGSKLVVAKGSTHDVPTHSPEIIVNKLVSILNKL